LLYLPTGLAKVVNYNLIVSRRRVFDEVRQSVGYGGKLTSALSRRRTLLTEHVFNAPGWHCYSQGRDDRGTSCFGCDGLATADGDVHYGVRPSEQSHILLVVQVRCGDNEARTTGVDGKVNGVGCRMTKICCHIVNSPHDDGKTTTAGSRMRSRILFKDLRAVAADE